MKNPAKPPRARKTPPAPTPDQGINRESDVAADLQIGPTNTGMVRLYVTGPGVDLPMDFDPDDAEAIAEDLMAAAMAARGGA